MTDETRADYARTAETIRALRARIERLEAHRATPTGDDWEEVSRRQTNTAPIATDVTERLRTADGWLYCRAVHVADGVVALALAFVPEKLQLLR